MILYQNEFRIATVAMFTSDLYAGSPPPHDLERLRTTMQRRVVDFVRVGYFIPLNGVALCYCNNNKGGGYLKRT